MGFLIMGTALSPSPTSTTGSRPRLSASATPPSMVLIGPQATPAWSGCRTTRPRSRREGLQQQGAQLFAVAVARRSWRSGGRRPDGRAPAQWRASRTGVVGGDDHDLAVAGGQRLVGEQARMRVAHPERHLAAGDERRAVVGHRRERRRQQIDLDVLALACRLRWFRAARMPIVACIPVMMSKTETPLR